MRVAYVHDWLDTYRGGEKVLEALLTLFPEAPLYTLFYRPRDLPATITQRRIVRPGVLAPFARCRKALLPILPTMIETLDLKEFDLIISSSSCVAKGAIRGPKAQHLCYIHSPMRYIWDQRDEYLQGWLGLAPVRAMINIEAARLRKWDVASASRVDRFLVNSNFVAQRVQRYYGRESSVVHPPVELERFQSKRAGAASGERFFLVAGAMVGYKRFELAIEACRRASKRLVVAGSGPHEGRLRQVADKANVHFVIKPSDAELTRLLQEAEALLFPGVEDFGIIAVEALACGTPVIAFANGGALDYVIPGKNGEFFQSAEADVLAKVIREFRADSFDAQVVAQTAQAFSRAAFLSKMKQHIHSLTGVLLA